MFRMSTRAGSKPTQSDAAIARRMPEGSAGRCPSRCAARRRVKNSGGGLLRWGIRAAKSDEETVAREQRIGRLGDGRGTVPK